MDEDLPLLTPRRQIPGRNLRMETKERFRKRLVELFNSQKLAALSTQKDGQPYARLVAFYASDDAKHLFL